MGLLSEGYLLGDFSKIFLGPLFKLFQKMRVLGDLAKIAITWSFGNFQSRSFSSKSSPVFALQEHTNQKIMPFAQVCFWAIQTRVTFWAIFEKFFLVLPLHFLRKWGFRVTLQKLPYLCHSGTFGAAFWAKIFSSLCTLSAYQLRDNAICARVLLGLSNEGYFQGDF